jgi:four helix bundle protein
MADSYEQLDIYQKSLELFFKTHKMSLNLPKHELYELGSQIRRSSDSINSNIVEGYGRKRYKADFIKFLVYAHSSCDETKNHLKKISFLYPAQIRIEDKLQEEYDILGAKIFNFIRYVEKNWKTN